MLQSPAQISVISLWLAVAVLLVLPSQSNAFVVVKQKLSPFHVLTQSVFSLQMSGDRDTTEEGDKPLSELSTPSAAVVCPDCDMCDGSGRYVLEEHCSLFLRARVMTTRMSHVKYISLVNLELSEASE
jgi:hypothetical protein